VVFGKGADFSVAKKNNGMLFKVAYDKGAKSFFGSASSTGQAIMEAF